MADSKEQEWPVTAEDYKIDKKVGEGAFAKVYIGTCIPRNEVCAIKVMDLEKITSNLDHLRQEVATMKLCRHTSALPLYASFTVKKELWLVMPFMDKGSILESMRQLSRKGMSGELKEAWIAAILKEVTKGLEYLHNSGWIHRDIKAGNILINSSGDVMLSDFGVAGILTDSNNARNTFVGTPCWMAPEVMKQSSGYTEKADIWSLGITALELAKTYAPYAKERTMKILLRTLQEKPPSLKTYEQYGNKGKKASDFSSNFKKFYTQCLVKDPTKRPSAKQLLQSRFLRSCKDAKTLLAAELVPLVPSIVDVDSAQEARDPGTKPVFAEEIASVDIKQDDDDAEGSDENFDMDMMALMVDPDKPVGAAQFTVTAAIREEIQGEAAKKKEQQQAAAAPATAPAPAPAPGAAVPPVPPAESPAAAAPTPAAAPAATPAATPAAAPTPAGGKDIMTNEGMAAAFDSF